LSPREATEAVDLSPREATEAVDLSPREATVAIRPGGEADVPDVIRLLDVAVEWLVANGRPGQWGTQPASGSPGRREQAMGWARSGALYMALVGDVAVGALAVGDAPAYVSTASEPELYVLLLVTHRARKGSGIGTSLLEHARSLARARGVSLMRVDCYAGDDRALVRYYESQDFTPTEPFTVDTPTGLWPGQVLEQRL
jgi:GNAT superfamily N-acetyltransferase